MYSPMRSRGDISSHCAVSFILDDGSSIALRYASRSRTNEKRQFEKYEWADAIVFAVLVVVLVVKPTGLLGKPMQEKV